MIIGIPSVSVDRFWAKAWAVLQRAFAYNAGELSEKVVYNKIINRDYQLWLEFIDGRINLAVVTSLIHYPEKTTCLILGLAGDNNESFKENLPIMEHWARTHGAKDIEFYGREGLKRSTKNLGFKLRYVVMAKELED